MSTCAVLGTGPIGCLVYGYLKHSGHDTDLLAAFRPERVEELKKTGLRMSGGEDDFRVPVTGAWIGAAGEKKYDYIFLAVKSNDLEASVPRLKGLLTDTGCLVTLENGINEELVEDLIGKGRVLAGTTFAGGRMVEPDHMESHEGFFKVGEMDGTISDRAREAAEILSCCRPSDAVSDIRAWQWDKLARVCLSVPSACISGLYLGSVFMEPRLQKLFALLALELFSVSEADGWPRDTVENKTKEEYLDILAGRKTGLEGREDTWPDGIVDAYSSDIAKGRPLEIGFTNGAVVRLGKKYGVPTPVNEFVMNTVFAIAEGTETRGFHQVEKALQLAGM